MWIDTSCIVDDCLTERTLVGRTSFLVIFGRTFDSLVSELSARHVTDQITLCDKKP